MSLRGRGRGFGCTVRENDIAAVLHAAQVYFKLRIVGSLRRLYASGRLLAIQGVELLG
jgi:hypothetical protein